MVHNDLVGQFNVINSGPYRVLINTANIHFDPIVRRTTRRYCVWVIAMSLFLPNI